MAWTGRIGPGGGDTTVRPRAPADDVTHDADRRYYLLWLTGLALESRFWVPGRWPALTTVSERR